MNQRQKILYVITKSNWGGAQKYIYDLATRLPPDQFDIAVVCGGRGPLAERLEERRVRIISIAGLERDINFAKELLTFFSFIKIIYREKPDIVHLNSSKVGGLGAIAAKLASLVTGHWSLVTFTVHGWPFREDRAWWQKLTISFLSWLSSLFQNKIILIDRADLATARWFIPETKLYLIAHGIAPIDFRPRESARAFFMQAIGQEEDHDLVLIGTIAELTKNKGLTYLIDAIKLIKSKAQNLKFKVMVIGEGEDRVAIERQIQTLGLGNIVHLIGFMPDAARYLKGLDIFVLPSVKEGLPYSIMEAMAAGLPVVATNVGGIPDLISDGKSGLIVPPKNAGAIAKAILALIDRPDRCQAMAQEAQKRIATGFDIEAMIAKTITVYQNR